MFHALLSIRLKLELFKCRLLNIHNTLSRYGLWCTDEIDGEFITLLSMSIFMNVMRTANIKKENIYMYLLCCYVISLKFTAPLPVEYTYSFCDFIQSRYTIEDFIQTEKHILQLTNYTIPLSTLQSGVVA